MRCAQHGCLVPDEHHEDELCPVCGNPLHLIDVDPVPITPVAGEHDDTLPSETEHPV